MGQVITVSGAVGGIGTSTFAYALAMQASGNAVLIDAQADGVPLDVLVGAEHEPGARWSQVRVQSDAIDAATIVSALPSGNGVHVLSADRDGTADGAAIVHLVSALREHCELVVLDIPVRHPVRPVIEPDLQLLLVPPTIAGVAATYATHDPALQLVVADTGNGDFPLTMVEDYLGLKPLGTIRWQRAVTQSMAACVSPPPTTDLIRLAVAIVDGWRHVE